MHRARRWFLGGLLLLTVVRLWIVACLPLDISGDEAYYWEWGRHLDWGYYSKPPGIGWLMAAAGWAGDDTVFGLRAVAVLLGTGTLWFVFRLGEVLYGTMTGIGAALAFAATPASAALAILLTPDPLLMLCWSSSLYFFWRFLERSGTSGRWAAAMALACGAGLLAKQMMIVFPICALLFQYSTRRGGLCRLGGWFALALLPLVPTIVWNAQHDWMMFKSTGQHFAAQEMSPVLCAGRLAELIGSQLGLATPILFTVVIASLLAAARHWRQLPDRERFLLLFSGPGLLAMFLATMRQRVNANWPAVFYLAAIVLAAGWVKQNWTWGQHCSCLSKAYRWGIGLAWVITLFLYAVAFVPSEKLLRTTGMDPTARLRGWSEIARDVAVQGSQLPNRESMIYIAGGHRWLTSTLAFYLPGKPRVYSFRHDPGRVESQHDLWETPGVQIGRDALIVIPGETNSIPRGLVGCFKSVRLLARMEYPAQRPAYRLVSVFHGIHLASWPTHEPPARRQLLHHE